MITIDLAHHLIASQFPQWKDLPIESVAESGWDNRTFRLGSELVIRLPSEEVYAFQVEKEQTWLPKIAPLFPCAIPTPVAMGQPSDEYPWHWSIYRWIEGEMIVKEGPFDRVACAKDLAAFLNALHHIDPSEGPKPGLHSFYRGGPLSHYDHEVQESLALLQGTIDCEKARAIWDQGLNTRWTNDPVWVHGDLSAPNLLARNGKLAAVIDFGQLTTGDPACDLSIAWTLFVGASRAAYRAALPLDDATWHRGRAWTLWKALIIASGLTKAVPRETAQCWPVLRQVMS